MPNEKAQKRMAQKREERALRKMKCMQTFPYQIFNLPIRNSTGAHDSASPSLGASQTSGAALSGPATLTDNASVFLSSVVSAPISQAKRDSLLGPRKNSGREYGLSKQRRRTRFKPKIVRRAKPLLDPIAPSLQPSSLERDVKMEDEKGMDEDERAADERANGNEFVMEHEVKHDIYYGAEDEDEGEGDRAYWDFEQDGDI